MPKKRQKHMHGKRKGNLTRDQRDMLLEKKARRKFSVVACDSSSSSDSSEGSDIPEDWLQAFKGPTALPPLSERAQVKAEEEPEEPPSPQPANTTFKVIQGYYIDPRSGKYFKHTAESLQAEKREGRERRQRQQRRHSERPLEPTKWPGWFQSLRRRELAGEGQRTALSESLPSHLTACAPLALQGFSAEFGLDYEPISQTLTVAGASQRSGECQVSVFSLDASSSFSSWPSSSASPHSPSSLSSSASSSSSSSSSCSWLPVLRSVHSTRSRVSRVRQVCPGGPLEGCLLEATLGGAHKASLRVIQHSSQRVLYEHQVPGSLWDFDCQLRDDNICLAASKKGYLVHVNSEHVQPIPTAGSDVLAQLFLEPSLVASGCRDGLVRFFDVRANPRSKPEPLTTPSSVGWAQGLPDGVGVVVASVDGSLLVFDRRFPRSPVALRQHVNSHSQLRGCVSEARTLFLGGEDGLLRGWGLREHALLLSLDPFSKHNRQPLPSSFSSPSRPSLCHVAVAGDSLLLGTDDGVLCLSPPC